MIVKAGTGKTFGGLQGYLLHGRTQPESGLADYLLGEGAERVAWVETRNLPVNDPRCAAAVMTDTARANSRVQKPVYHLSIAAPPGEELSRQQWNDVVDRLLGRLGLTEHQALVVAHNDTKHPHVHVMVNRVHPETVKAWSNSHDYARIEKALRHIERDLGLREVPGHHHQLAGQKPPEREGKTTSGERQEAKRTTEPSWADQIRFKVYEDLRKAESWGELERRLAAHGLRLERRGGGLVITDGNNRVKASRIYRRASYRRLEERFGMSFEQWRSARRGLFEAVARYLDLERRRDDLERLRDRAWRSYQHLLEAVRERDRIREACRGAASDLNKILAQLFRAQDVPKVRRRLANDARRHGWREAARRLVERPGRYGRRRRSWRRLHPHMSRRRYRSLLLRRLLSTATDLAMLRSARMIAGPAGYRAVTLALSARRTWQRAARRRNGLPPSKTVLKEIAGRAIALGVSAVTAVAAPQPLTIIRLALRSAQLARAVGRGVSR